LPFSSLSFLCPFSPLFFIYFLFLLSLVFGHKEGCVVQHTASMKVAAYSFFTAEQTRKMVIVAPEAGTFNS